MSKALIFGAEAYHTRGAIHHVVWALKMNKDKTSVTVMDFWVSVIENWAETNKVFARCVGSAETYLLLMCKYLLWTCNTMKEIHTALLKLLRVRNALTNPINASLPKYSQ